MKASVPQKQGAAGRHPKANRTSFKPGQSGNPGGRPKGATREMAEIARDFGPSGIIMLAEMAGLAPGKRATPDTARVAAIKELLDRGYGRAPLPISGDEDRPLIVDFRWAGGDPVAATTQQIESQVVEAIDTEWTEEKS